jgi:hypothetical protein
VPVLERLARHRRPAPWGFTGTPVSRLDDVFTALLPR